MAEVKRETGEITLDGLADDYEIVGELRGMDDVRRFLATRRNDGAEVMIAVVHAGSGAGDNTALSHYGSDVNVLRAASHPGVLQVLEGKWLGPATFAAVTERPHGRSLREMVAAGDRVANARIATMLQDVNAVLEWARAQDVVHRGIRPETAADFIDSDGLVRLPHSGMRFREPNCVRLRADGTDEVAGVAPDLPVPAFEGEDDATFAARVLNAVRAHLCRSVLSFSCD